jgi:hypothetical protein
MPSAADRQLIDYAAVSNIHSFLFPLAMYVARRLLFYLY